MLTETWETPLTFSGHFLLHCRGHRQTMYWQQWWGILAVECIFICISSQFLHQKRQCAFEMNTAANKRLNYKYLTAGNVSGSVQVCENTHCCVGYYLVINGQPQSDILACDVAEKSCPEKICMEQTRFSGRFLKCVCSADLCNKNITLNSESEETCFNSNTHSEGITITVCVAVFGFLLFLFFGILAAKRRHLINDKKEILQSCSGDHSLSQLLSCQTTKNSKTDIMDIDFQKILGHGSFATVWQGTYQGSMVAVKVFPAHRKDQFTAEKEVFELPLMKRDEIVHFLGAGRHPDGSSWMIVLQFVEYGSLHSFLCKHTINWTMSLKLFKSLSQGLSYLHSDLHECGLHKPPVAHRDLSSCNVLVRADGTCALSGFGCATILRSCSSNCSWQSNLTYLQDCPHLGTLRYMAPEILEGSVNLNNSWCLMQGDVYALGLLLWEIWMRCSDLFEDTVVPQHLLPYESELEGNVTLERLIVYVSNMDKRPSIPNQWRLQPQGSAVQELLMDCWDYDPEARLTAQCAADRLVILQSCFSS